MTTHSFPATFTNLPQVAPPLTPARGMAFWVQTSSHWSMGDNHSIAEVNSRSFYTHTQGKRHRHLRGRWSAWLQARFDEGHLYLNGHHVRPFSSPPTGAPTMANLTIDFVARDRRFFRAGRDVLKRYTINRDAVTEGRIPFRITGGRLAYTVHVDPSWSHSPTCSCPDAKHGAKDKTNGFCKHVIAVLLSNTDVRCQLLDVLL